MRRSWISLSALALNLLFTSAALATDVSGPVSGTWTLAGSPYNVIGQLNIPSGQELVIEPGVQGIFQGWYKFLIYGRLQANGTEADSILFTAADTTVGWHGLRFYDTGTQPDSSRLVYCHISYGRSSERNGAGEDKNGGAVYCSNSSSLLVANCLFDRNHTADVTGVPGQTGDPGTPGEDVTSGHGGAIYLNASDPLICDNSFCFNQTGKATGGTGGEGNDNSGFQVSGDNGGPGGDASSGNGGAISLSDGSPEIARNLFYFNHAGDASGGEGGQGGYAMITVNGGNAWGGDGSIGGSSLSGSGGAIHTEAGNPIIKWNVFQFNYTGNAVGGRGGPGGYAHAAFQVNASHTYGGDAGDGNDGSSGGGGAVWFSGSSEDLSFNLFFEYNRTGYGAGGDGGDGGGGQMYGIYENHFGGDGGNGGDGIGGNGGCFWANGDGLLIKNTITESTCGAGSAGQGGYGGLANQIGEDGNPGNGTNGRGIIYCDAMTPQISNSIVWNNGGEMVVGNPPVMYSCIQGGYSGIGVIDENPQFLDPLNDDYHLQWTSPCIDAGDPNSPLDPDSTRADMGCFYYDQWVPVAPIITSWYPEDLDTVWINETVNFGIQAVDPNGDSLSYLWTLNGNEVGMDSAISISFDSAGIFDIWAFASDGQLSDSVGWTATVISLAVHENPIALPGEFALYGAYPNPFNASSMIRFGLPVAAWVQVEVFDIAGRLVGLSGSGTTPTTGYYPAGVYEVAFDGSDLPSGIYLLRLQAGDFEAVQKMVLLK